MELYNFFRGTLAWTATIACLWPLNIPLLAFAFKIQNGSKPIDMENDEYWWRSSVGALVLGMVTAGFIFVDYMLADWAELPPGPIHMIVFAGYVPAAVWVLTLFFAMDDLMHGLSLFIIYIYLPVLAVLGLNGLLWLVKLNIRWDWFYGLASPWLKTVT